MDQAGVTVKSASQLESEEKSEIDARTRQASPVLSQLAGYINKCYQDAEMHRNTTGITERILKSRRLKAGEYEPAKKAAIQQRGGCDTFFNITEPKCEQFEAWMEDVFSPVGDRAWDLSPTPIPSLDVETTGRIAELVIQELTQNQPEMLDNPEFVREYTLKAYDETLELEREEAEKRCERMSQKIEDQTVEGGLPDVLSEFIVDLGTYPTAIIEGPVFEQHKRLKWDKGQVEAVDEVVPKWYCVDPFNFYPGPNCRNIDESYLCIVKDYDRAQLAEMREVDGWSSSAIDLVLGYHRNIPGVPGDGAAAGPEQMGESEMARLEGRQQIHNSGLPSSSVRGIHFWGSVQGAMLTEWGMKNIDNAMGYQEVHCIMVEGYVVRAILNPNPLGKRPFYADSFVRNKNSIWGLESLPEKMLDCQDGVNGAMRNLMNNLAIASGPIGACDLDAIPPSHHASVQKLRPWLMIPYNGKSINGTRKPVDFFQPNSNASELLAVAEHFEKKADDRTLIPRYVTGDDDVRGAGQTASGLSMLMNAASRGIKRVIKSVDRHVMRPLLQYLYVYNMLNLDDDELKGDAQVVPRGALAILVREQVQARRQEFLNMTNNPIDMEIIGPTGRASVLREVAKGLDLPVDKVVPSEEELRARYAPQPDPANQDGQQPNNQAGAPPNE